MNQNIVRFEQMATQTVDGITRVLGLVKVKDIINIIDNLDLEANPRSSKTNKVTASIQESLSADASLFPFKTKGILLAASDYTMLERGRIIIRPQDRQIEGILDGGHNTLAIGLYILRSAMGYSGKTLSSKINTWTKFKQAWKDNRDLVDVYLKHLKEEPDPASGFDTLVPVELLVPRDPDDQTCAESFRNNLLEICSARNNNVQLAEADKANQLGLFDDLKRIIEGKNPYLKGRIQWKSNEGTGEIKAQDIVVLAWIPLSLVRGIQDETGHEIKPPAPVKLYSAKGSCENLFNKFMASPNVTEATDEDYKRILVNEEVESAFKVAATLPKLYDYIYAAFPNAYNAASGKYGKLAAVKSLNERRNKHVTPFQGEEVDTLNPDGFIMPLVYSLVALMERRQMPDGTYRICWKVDDPMAFLQDNLGKIVEKYKGIFEVCDNDPQKVGKSAVSYNVTREACEAIYNEGLIRKLMANQ